jgi:hypothetical protein
VRSAHVTVAASLVRVACPWLIERFVDEDADLGHHGAECSIDAFVHR